jgi:nitroreductase
LETWDAIRARRNVRSYEDRPILLESLDRILEAGRRSPSSRNEQRWDFVVVTDSERLEQLSEAWQGAGHVARSAATVLPGRSGRGRSGPAGLHRVRPRPGDDEHGALAAADLGIESGHASVRDKDLGRGLLSLPPDREPAYLLAFGYPDTRPLEPLQRPDRKLFDDVVHRGTW